MGRDEKTGIFTGKVARADSEIWPQAEPFKYMSLAFFGLSVIIITELSDVL